MKSKLRRFVSDRGGRVVIAQWPNLPAVAALALAGAAGLTGGHARETLAFFAGAFLVTWSYLEIRCGDSPFRRVLGAVVLAAFAAWKSWG
ncbi:MAG: hypothetical protein ACOY37_06385 [Pseudomonadota bacterium]